MKQWFLLTTKLKNERRVKMGLETKHQIPVYFPLYPGKKQVALFPRYVFARFDLLQDIDKVRYAPGVGRIVSFGDDPTPVSEEIIACLRERCESGQDFVCPTLEAGQTVSITQGIFEGCQGIIDEKRGSNRVQLLLKVAFGRSLKVELNTKDVVPI